MHITKDQFGSIHHVLEEKFGDSLEEETLPHYRYDEKIRGGVLNGNLHVYTFQNNKKKFKLEVAEKEKVAEHEKTKDGRVVGRHFETIKDQYTYSMELFEDDFGDWKKMDLDLADLLL